MNITFTITGATTKQAEAIAALLVGDAQAREVTPEPKAPKARTTKARTTKAPEPKAPVLPLLTHKALKTWKRETPEGRAYVLANPGTTHAAIREGRAPMPEGFALPTGDLAAHLHEEGLKRA